jgi:hypothetical protein
MCVVPHATRRRNRSEECTVAYRIRAIWCLQGIPGTSHPRKSAWAPWDTAYPLHQQEGLHFVHSLANVRVMRTRGTAYRLQKQVGLQLVHFNRGFIQRCTLICISIAAASLTSAAQTQHLHLSRWCVAFIALPSIAFYCAVPLLKKNLHS